MNDANLDDSLPDIEGNDNTSFSFSLFISTNVSFFFELTKLSMD